MIRKSTVTFRYYADDIWTTGFGVAVGLRD
jgi:hypothetical protein